MKGSRSLRLGTRGSRLALAQTAIVVDLISRSSPGLHVEVVRIKTSGDAAQQGEPSGADRKLAFTHEIDRRLLEGKVDLAVHSMKDVPTVMDRRLTIAATPPRDDARDALVTVSGETFGRLRPGSAVGTSSVRRRVQLGRLRPDIRVAEVRGNVETRIGRMKDSGLEGVVLAAAGLRRLGLADKASQCFTVDEMIPAACQGILAVEARTDDPRVLAALRKIDDYATHLQGACERAFLARLGGDCNFPAAAYAQFASAGLKVTGMVANPDGSSMAVESASGKLSGAEELGAGLAERLLESKERLG